MTAFLVRHRALVAILLVAWALRIGIVIRGGQANSSDEFRYNFALLAATRIQAGDAKGAVGAVYSSYGHVGFTVLMVPVALVEALVAPPHGTIEEQELKLPAAFLSTASVACIGLTYAIALQLGASLGEALLAALLAAASNALFYWSRAIVPYDAAMACHLAALWIGIGRGREIARSAAAGALTSFGFFVYLGSWYLAASVVAGCLLIGRRERAVGLVPRGAALLLGALAFPLTLAGAARAASQPGALLDKMRIFSDTITEGAFDEGWRLPFLYFWHAEHALALAWAVGAAAVLVLAWRDRPAAHRRGLTALGLAAGTYAALAVTSTGLHRFVVYGRLAREMVPFLCLATAYAMTVARARWPSRRLAATGAVALAVNTALSFWPVFAQQFPLEVRRAVAREHGPFDEEFTIDASVVYAMTVPPERSRASRWVVLDARSFARIRGVRQPPPGRVVFETPHPIAWTPGLFDGFTPEERVIIQAARPTIRILDRGEPPTPAPR